MSNRTSPELPRGPIVLVILDGWGIGRDEPGNAILSARTPTMDNLLGSYPNATLRCSGEAVGLPDGQMGNSEVGHLNIGSGFVVFQSISRIDNAIHDGSLANNTVLSSALRIVRESGGTVHFVGLVSEGGVHSHVRHLEALVQITINAGVDRIAIHAFTDGRDTPPDSALATIRSLQATLDRLGTGSIATVSGRYFAMDRDNRWERTLLAFDAIANGRGLTATTPASAILDANANGATDEFIPPTVITSDGTSPWSITPGDVVLEFNFRSDRMRQLTAALSEPDFVGFDRGGWRPNVPILTLTRYDADLSATVIFPPHDVVTPLARAISEAGLAQFHCAETEKYPHVTYFLNGGREDPFPGETRVVVPSPHVATYDMQPEMSAATVTERVVTAITSGQFPFIVVNFANCDMVGHTGVFAAAVAAVETVDACLAQVVDATLVARGVALVTADHGNAEVMVDPLSGGPMTAHTTNPVPVILVTPLDHPAQDHALRHDGNLSAIAPTVLELLNVPIPEAMTTPSLLRRRV